MATLDRNYDPYEAMLEKLEPEQAKALRLVHEQIAVAWNRGDWLIDIAKRHTCHYADVMAVVRALGLYERFPKWPGPDPNEMPQRAE
jgi:hypothetical protein